MVIGIESCKDSSVILILQQDVQIIQNVCPRQCIRNIFLYLIGVLHEIAVQNRYFRAQNSNKIIKVVSTWQCPSQCGSLIE